MGGHRNGYSYILWARSLIFQQLGQVFIPKLDEGNIALHSLRMTSTGITKSSELQLLVEKTISQFPEVEFAFSKTGTAEVATDPDAAKCFRWVRDSQTSKINGLILHDTKEDVRQRIEEALKKVPGQMYEFTQPIEMRFNELIAGVRGRRSNKNLW